MNILLCGKADLFTRQMAKRLEQEKNDIYLLSEAPLPEEHMQHILQKNCFPYASKSALRFVLNANPEIVIILGACDTFYQWKNPENDAMPYIINLTSLLMDAKRAKVRQVIYLSTVNVFEENEETEISGSTVPVVSTLVGDTMLHAENICREFQDENMSVCILRMPQVFGDYESECALDVCLQMLISADNLHTVSYMENAKRSLVYALDAADIVCRVVAQEEYQKSRIINIDGELIEEEEAAKLLADAKKCKCEKKGENALAVYPPACITDAANERLRYSPRYSVAQGLEKLETDYAAYCAKRTKAKRQGIAISTVVENVVFAAVALGVSLVARGSIIGEFVNFFFFYVLVLGCVYGSVHGLLAAFLATVGQLILGMQDASLVDVLGSGSFQMGFLQYVVIGAITGRMHDKYALSIGNTKDESEYLAKEFDDLVSINDSNVYAKNIYERRLLGYQSSIAVICDSTLKLDYSVSQKIVYQAVEMISQVMGIENVCLYVRSLNADSDYFRLAARTNAEAAILGTTLHLGEDNFLYDAISKGETYENKELAENHPTFAAAVKNDESIYAIAMVWTDDLEKVTLYEKNVLMMLCRLIAGAIGRALEYEKLVQKESYIEDTRVMNQRGFLQMVDIYEEGKKRELLEYRAMRFPAQGRDRKEVQKLFRDTDILGEVGDYYYVLLANADERAWDFVTNKLKQNEGIVAEPVEAEGLLAGE